MLTLFYIGSTKLHYVQKVELGACQYVMSNYQINSAKDRPDGRPLAFFFVFISIIKEILNSTHMDVFVESFLDSPLNGGDCMSTFIVVAIDCCDL